MREGAMALDGLRVVNLGWMWSAGVASHLLADMGAEVIKVESRSNMDRARVSGLALGNLPNESFFGHNLLRSARSVTLNLRTPEGAAMARDLIRQSDAVIENYRPGVLDRSGLGYPALREARPDIVMVSLSAYGQTGPRRNLSGFGTTLACITGMNNLQGYGPEEPRAFSGAILDPYNGVAAVCAILAALRHRDRTGQGQHIDLAQAENTVAMFGAPILDYQWNGRLHHAMGNRALDMAPHGVYRCKGDDAWISIAVGSQDEWRGLCDALGRPEWTADPRFADGYRRLRRQDVLDEAITVWTSQREPMEAARALQAAGVAAFPSMSCRDIFEDPHYHARESWVEVRHVHGKEVIYGLPLKLRGTPGRIRRPAPSLGQDNGAILHDLLGFPEGDLAALEERQVVW